MAKSFTEPTRTEVAICVAALGLALLAVAASDTFFIASLRLAIAAEDLKDALRRKRS